MFPAPSAPRGGAAVVGGFLPIKFKDASASALVLTAADTGFCTVLTNSGGFGATLPLVASVPPGAVLQILNASGGPCLIQRAGTDIISGGSSGTSFQLREGGPTITFFAWSGKWYVISMNGAGTGLGAVAIGAGAYGLGTNSVAIGASASAQGVNAVAVGVSSAATGQGAVAVGNSTFTDQNFQTAIGANSGGGASSASSGLGAMALGGSYASGTDSFAAAIADNTSTYGAQGANSIAIGKQAKATAQGGVAIGGIFALASGNYAVALGNNAAAQADYAIAIGQSASSLVVGKLSIGSAISTIATRPQTGILPVGAQTTTAVAKVLTSDGAAASTNNQLILPNDTSCTFTGNMIARNTGSDTDSKAWTFFGAIRRGTSAATTALIGTPGINVVGSDGSAWTFTLTADTTNGGLAVTVTGEAAKTINWVCRIDTVEVTG